MKVVTPETPVATPPKRTACEGKAKQIKGLGYIRLLKVLHQKHFVEKVALITLVMMIALAPPCC